MYLDGKEGEGSGKFTGKLFPHMGFVLQKERERKERVDRKALSKHKSLVPLF
jgi:hypothetical protein